MAELAQSRYLGGKSLHKHHHHNQPGPPPSGTNNERSGGNFVSGDVSSKGDAAAVSGPPMRSALKYNSNTYRRSENGFAPLKRVQLDLPPSLDNSNRGGGNAAASWSSQLVNSAGRLHGSSTSAMEGSSAAQGRDSNKGIKSLKVVEIDSLALLKIVKHCSEHFPTSVMGQLLGMDAGEKLEITNCFPLPTKSDISAALLKERSNIEDIDEKVEEELEKYQDQMTELMHDVNIDCFTVGWYQTVSFGDLKNKDVIDSLVIYQQLVDKAVVLGFDPLLNSLGRMALKAFHVSSKYLALCSSGHVDSSQLNKLSSMDILVEIPLVIRNGPLADIYLLEWAQNDPMQGLADFDTLELDQNNYLEKSVKVLTASLDSLMEEQDKLQKYQRDHVKQVFAQKQLEERHKLENEQRLLSGEAPIPMEYTGQAYKHIEPPSQLNALLLSNQAAMQANEINSVCAENLLKMFLLSKSNATGYK